MLAVGGAPAVSIWRRPARKMTHSLRSLGVDLRYVSYVGQLRKLAPTALYNFTLLQMAHSFKQQLIRSKKSGKIISCI